MAPTPTALPTEEEILARFHRLRITIGLSATNFGYTIMGQPGLIRRLTEGKKLRVKGRRKCGEVLDTLEREHSVPIPDSVNKNRTNVDGPENRETNNSVQHSEMED